MKKSIWARFLNLFGARTEPPVAERGPAIPAVHVCIQAGKKGKMTVYFDGVEWDGKNTSVAFWASSEHLAQLTHKLPRKYTEPVTTSESSSLILHINREGWNE